MWFASRFMAIVWVGTGLLSRIVLAAVFHQRIRWLLCQPWAREMSIEQTGSNRTHTMAMDRLGNYTGKEKHTA